MSRRIRRVKARQSLILRVRCLAATGQRYGALEFGELSRSDCFQDGQKIIGAGADNTARVLDLASNGAPALQVAGHDAPIKSVRFFTTSRANAAMIATGSWDKTVKYWDLRQPTSVASLTCKERVYSMDIKRDLLAIGTAERHINLVNLQNPTSFFKSIESPLKHQTRVVSCFTDADGIVIGGIEGRCSIVYRYPSDHEYV